MGSSQSLYYEKLAFWGRLSTTGAYTQEPTVCRDWRTFEDHKLQATYAAYMDFYHTTGNSSRTSRRYADQFHNYSYNRLVLVLSGQVVTWAVHPEVVTLLIQSIHSPLVDQKLCVDMYDLRISIVKTMSYSSVCFIDCFLVWLVHRKDRMSTEIPERWLWLQNETQLRWDSQRETQNQRYQVYMMAENPFWNFNQLFSSHIRCLSK